MKKLFSLLLLAPTIVFGMELSEFSRKAIPQPSYSRIHTNLIELDRESIVSPTRLNHLSVFHDAEGFIILDKHINIRVKPHNLDKELRNISSRDLATLMTASHRYISLKEIDGEDYKLELNERIIGGGPGGAILGWFCGFLGTFIAGTIVRNTVPIYDRHLIDDNLFEQACKGGAAGVLIGISIPF
jgi:hypothetical protein